MLSHAPNPSRRVLIVEDNEDNRIIYGTLLRFSGFEVRDCVDGVDGLKTAREWLPNLILMDVALPGLDGLTATRRLKADPETRHIVIVAITAHAMVEDRARALDAGCDAYISKPADPVFVLHEVKRLLGHV